jgi:cytochrome b subunit of formate dehydrogenase
MDNNKKRKQTIRRIGRIFGWLGLGLLLFTLLTGYGIAEFRIVTPLTFNLMNKAVAQRLHSYTEVPMILLLLVHVGVAVWARSTEGKKKEG